MSLNLNYLNNVFFIYKYYIYKLNYLNNNKQRFLNVVSDSVYFTGTKQNIPVVAVSTMLLCCVQCTQLNRDKWF